MKIEQMEYAVEIAQVGSISEAAGKFFLSQSSLSQSIKALEKELGSEIFVRTNRGVTLTNYGKEFVSYARSILQQISQIRTSATGHHRTVPQLSVWSAGYRFMVNACATLANRYRDTGIEITIRDDSNFDMLDYVSAGMCDIGTFRIWSSCRAVIKKQLQTKSLQFFPLATRVPISITVGRGNPLFDTKRSSVSRRDLEGLPLVIREHANDGVQSAILKDLNLPAPRNKFITTTFSAQYTLLDTTDGYFFGATPRSLHLDVDNYPQVRSLILEDCDITAEIGWIKNEKDPLSPLAKEFIEIVRTEFPEI